MEILYTCIIMLILSLIFSSIIVAIDTKEIKVEDKRFDKIRNLIAGINCGCCGFYNCDNFCKNLLIGKCKVDDCKITKNENKQKINKILNKK
jgi:Na+-translocating ferredoxin:NAD+ oxidoreductase RNF subunit RnfB